MKRFLKFIVLTVFLCLTANIFAQQKTEQDNSTTKKVSEIFNYRSSTSNYLILKQVESQNMAHRSSANNNQNVTIITQIGNDNRAVTEMNTENFANLNYFQNGNNNAINSSNFILNTTENVVQNGNNNNFTNFSLGNVDTSSLNLLQQGNNLTFEKFGTNALTNKISLKTIGDNKTIIIRSF